MFFSMKYDIMLSVMFKSDSVEIKVIAQDKGKIKAKIPQYKKKEIE